MPITVQWDEVMERVVMMVYRGVWTWEDYVTAYAQMQAMVNSTDGRIDRIIDTTSKIVSLPPGFGRRAVEVAGKMDERVVLSVIVGNEMNRDILRALAAGSGVFQRRFTFTFSMDDARRLIAESRENDMALNGARY